MTRSRFFMIVALITVLGIAHVTAQTTPAKAPTTGKLQLKDLPAAVRATVEAETKNATLKGLSKERANGKTVFEVESLVNGRTRDLMIDANGKVYEVEEQLDADKAPPAVKAALEAKGRSSSSNQ